MRYSVPIVARRLQLAVTAVIGVILAWPPGLAAEVILKQLANEGVIISDGQGTDIMIDGLVVEPYSVYGGLAQEFHAQFLDATGSFSGIDLALASHQHHDHNQPAYACLFMQKSKDTLFVSSSQVTDLMREKCRQFMTTSSRVRVIAPGYDNHLTFEAGAAKVTVFLLSHGVGKYASLSNFAHLVEIGGMRILHVGDAAMDVADFERARVDQMGIDIALIPFWYFQPGPGGEVVRRFLDAPNQVAVHIPPKEMEEVKAYLAESFPHVRILEQPLEEVRFSPNR